MNDFIRSTTFFDDPFMEKLLNICPKSLFVELSFEKIFSLPYNKRPTTVEYCGNKTSSTKPLIPEGTPILADNPTILFAVSKEPTVSDPPPVITKPEGTSLSN
ncbi:MAG TPA: hypothetical protein VK338_03505, partial [Candidatus Nitrosocosmicus sp.]|nr:hypothetical protein [Candidatus Nitrosocosmicus sp.]